MQGAVILGGRERRREGGKDEGREGGQRKGGMKGGKEGGGRAEEREKGGRRSEILGARVKVLQEVQVNAVDQSTL